MPDAARPLTGLAEIAERYELALCDVWGVLHNGIAAHAGAADALTRYRGQGGAVVLITNAPRPSGPIVAMLDRMGVPRAAYDAIISSGDVTRSMIAPFAGRVIHHFGPPRVDDALYEGLGVTLGAATEAEAVVVTDMPDDDDTPEMYEAELDLWLERRLPLICANPDKFVEVGDRLVYCGGAMADLYAERGGEVRMAGKPFRPIYERAMAMAEAATGRALDRTRMLAIGDSARTDAQGAADLGADLLFITGSIHAAELDAFGATDPVAVAELLAPSGVRIAGFMPRLAW